MFNLKVINTNRFTCQLVEYDDVSQTLLGDIADFILSSKECDYKTHGAYSGLIRHLASLGLSERDANIQVNLYMEKVKHAQLQEYCSKLGSEFCKLSEEYSRLFRKYHDLHENVQSDQFPEPQKHINNRNK